MRLLAIIFGFIILGIGSVSVSLVAVRASDEFLTGSVSLLGLSEESRFSGKVAGEAIDSMPVLPEDRRVSTEYVPIRKAGSYNLAVPTAHAAILIDAATGKALYENNADERRAIASITKLFTAMIVVEEVENLDEIVTVSERAVSTEGTRVGCPRTGYCIGERLHVGERISVRNLLRAALMNSANDAALALAEHVGGSEEAFVAKMNARAKDLELTNTHFCTPSGLELDENEDACYSSARDVARFSIQALTYDVLWSTMRNEKAIIVSADGKYEHEIFNTDELLGLYPNLVGTKTGFTPRAGYSLAAVAKDPTDGQHTLIAVVLDDLYRWQSIRTMLDWGFQSFEWK